MTESFRTGIAWLSETPHSFVTLPAGSPPLPGMNLFIASYRFERPVIDVYRATIPFFIILLITVLVITYWPALSMVLVG